MKLIGLIGGMSWESSAHYYRIVNERTRALCGGLHSARTLLLSVDFEPIEKMQAQGRWDDAARELARAARSLERGGAELVLLCTNTMHKVADSVARAVGVPFVHIADPTALAIRQAGIRRVGLLGTRFTMEEDFYVHRLAQIANVEIVVPSASSRSVVHRIIYDELCQGRILEESRRAYLSIIQELIAGGAEAIVFGCTEIMLLVDPAQVAIPVFDTTTLHAHFAVDYALQRVELPGW
jgi:aspartate racemase